MKPLQGPQSPPLRATNRIASAMFWAKLLRFGNFQSYVVNFGHLWAKNGSTGENSREKNLQNIIFGTFFVLFGQVWGPNSHGLGPNGPTMANDGKIIEKLKQLC